MKIGIVANGSVLTNNAVAISALVFQSCIAVQDYRAIDSIASAIPGARIVANRINFGAMATSPIGRTKVSNWILLELPNQPRPRITSIGPEENHESTGRRWTAVF